VWLEVTQGFHMECSLWAQEQWLRLVHVLVPVLHKISKSLKRFHRRQRQAAVKQETSNVEGRANYVRGRRRRRHPGTTYPVRANAALRLSTLL
jgi:hypothetical protein